MTSTLSNTDTTSTQPSVSSLSFDSLVNFHKQEGSEEMTYITIVFTIVLGVLAFMGSARYVNRFARIILAVTITLTILFFASALLSSLVIHNALHVEIGAFVKRNPKLFITPSLYDALVDLRINNSTHVIFGFTGIWLVTVLAILFMGKGAFKIGWLKRK